MTAGTAASIEIAFRIATGAFIMFALAVFVWTVVLEIRERERRDDEDNRR